ncbi:MAG TPA: hypothetical protein VLL97_03585 [Acidobacteriota bacterium]|nr:hypothetical protein [Acidobacteriota bacterium]
MKSHILTASVSIVLFTSLFLPAADLDVIDHAKKLDGRSFYLKAPLEIFDIRHSPWGKHGTDLYTAKPSDHYTTWLGTAIIRPIPYTVRDIDHNKRRKRIQIKMESLAGISLEFTFENIDALNADQFDRMFFSLFFKPDEDVADYVRMNNLRLAEKYLSVDPSLLLLSDEAKIAIINILSIVGTDSKPKVIRTDKGLYLTVTLLGDYSNRHSRNAKKVIAEAIEHQMDRIRQSAYYLLNIPVFSGICYKWDFMHTGIQDLPGNIPLSFLHRPTLELYAEMRSLAELVSGLLSPYQFADTSFLFLNGKPITFTSWESSWSQ